MKKKTKKKIRMTAQTGSVPRREFNNMRIWEKLILTLLVMAVLWCIAVVWWYANAITMPYTPPLAPESYGDWLPKISATSTPLFNGAITATSSPDRVVPNPSYGAGFATYTPVCFQTMDGGKICQ